MIFGIIKNAFSAFAVSNCACPPTYENITLDEEGVMENRVKDTDKNAAERRDATHRAVTKGLYALVVFAILLVLGACLINRLNDNRLEAWGCWIGLCGAGFALFSTVCEIYKKNSGGGIEVPNFVNYAGEIIACAGGLVAFIALLV